MYPPSTKYHGETELAFSSAFNPIIGRCEAQISSSFWSQSKTLLSSKQSYLLNFQHITETCSLSVLMCFLFLRVHFQLKLLISCFIVAAHMACVLLVQPRLFQVGNTTRQFVNNNIGLLMSVLVVTNSSNVRNDSCITKCSELLQKTLQRFAQFRNSLIQ